MVASRRQMEKKWADERQKQREAEVIRETHTRLRVKAYVNQRSYPVLPRNYK